MAVKEKMLTSAVFKKMAQVAITNGFIRRKLLKMFEKWMTRELLEANPDERPLEIQKED